MQAFLSRRTWLKGAGAALGAAVSRVDRPARAAGQASAPIVTRTDFVYGRVEGSALLANLAWPDGPGLKPGIVSVHGGRWRAGNRTDASSIKVVSWAEFGFFAMSIDYRLSAGHRPLRHTSTCAVRSDGYTRTLTTTASIQIVSTSSGSRPADISCRSPPRSATVRIPKPAAGARPKRCACGDQRGGRLRSQHIVMGQSLDSHIRQRRASTPGGLSDHAREPCDQTDARHSFRR